MLDEADRYANGVNPYDRIEESNMDYRYKPKKRKKKQVKMMAMSEREPRPLPPLIDRGQQQEVGLLNRSKAGPGLKRIDYVLVYPDDQDVSSMSHSERKEHEKNQNYRQKFERACLEAGLELEKESYGENVFVKIHCPFSRLSEEAEHVKIEMDLKDAVVPKDENPGCYSKLMAKFEVDDEDDYVSAPYITMKRMAFKGIEDPETFFRPATRSYLVNNIMLNIDISEETDEKDEDHLKKKGLPFMLIKNSYTDAFILHDESIYELDKERREKEKDAGKKHGKEENTAWKESKNLNDLDKTWDARKVMDLKWAGSWTKFQPMWKIRNYFGEKIALYLAWSGTLISTLWIPTLLGIALTIYGIILSVNESNTIPDIPETSTHTVENVTVENVTSSTPGISTQSSIVDEALNIYRIIKESFDNKATPYFGLIICLWGTLFLEVWKRRNAKLAYEWDVDNYENFEPDRPQFFGTKERKDPVSDLPDWYYPFYRQFVKFMASGSILIVMVLCVLASVVGVIVYRVISKVDWSKNATEEFIYSTLISAILNSLSIMILGKVYDMLAYRLTDWENHRTQTAYDDALIIKLFAFQFANSYASLYYIAFFRNLTVEGGILDFGAEYNDSCADNNCMSALSFQVLVLMIMKPFPKFFKDLILPWGLKIFRRLWKRSKRSNKVKDEQALADQDPSVKLTVNDYLERERLKPPVGDTSRSPPVGDFTLTEYLEKVLQYGYLMLFSCSLPLAPLIALLTNLIDLRVDAKRLLWFNRRPVALVAQDIGMWYYILNLLNVLGVITNGFIIFYTSAWGKQWTDIEKIWGVLIFEHTVFILKALLAYLIPDVPSDVTLAMRRENYQVGKIMDNTVNFPISPRKSKSRSEYNCPSNYQTFNYSSFDGHNHNQQEALYPDYSKGDYNHKSKSSETPATDQLYARYDIASPPSSKASQEPSPEFSYSHPSTPTLSSKSLAYGEHGETYVGVSEKFIEPDHKNKKKKKKKHKSSHLEHSPPSPSPSDEYRTTGNYNDYHNTSSV